jgi:hypothetical protein
MVVRKRRTRQHVIADLSVNHFERHALLCGYSVERVRNDYGYDLFLFTYDENGEIENGDIRVQLKATDTLPALREDGTFAYRLSRSDLILWLNELMPVILVVYDAITEIAYWLDVQLYFDRLDSFNLFAAGRTVTVYISLADVLDQNAIRTFSKLQANEYRQTRRQL